MKTKFPQFIHVSKTVLVTNINRPEHPWTVRYTVTTFAIFEEKRERHFNRKVDAMAFAEDAAKGMLAP